MFRNRIFATLFAVTLLATFLAAQAIVAPQDSIVHAQATSPTVDFDTIAYVPDYLRGPVVQAVIDRSSSLPDDDLFYSTSFRFSDESDQARIVLVPAYVIDADWENLATSDLVEIWLEHQSDGTWVVPQTKTSPDPDPGVSSLEYRFPWTANQTWYKNGGFHDGLAIDFQPQTSNFDVLAASDGTLDISCGPDAGGQVWLSVGSAVYGHIDADTVPTNLLAKQIARGQKIGELFDPNSGGRFDTRCGNGDASHLHYDPSVTRTDLVSNTTYYWEVQAKYGKTTVTANGGWWSFTTAPSVNVLPR